MPIELKKITATPFFREYEGDEFQAIIHINRYDRMVFATLKTLPQALAKKEAAIREFMDMLDVQYGAKCILTVPTELIPPLLVPALKITNGNFNARYINRENAAVAIRKIRENNKKVSGQLEKFDTKNYILLTKKELLLMTDQLNQFKIDNAPFITDEKKQQGLYSIKAEADKLNNPYVEHYAIQSKGKIIAYVMVAKHDGYGYISDYIVDSQHRNQGNSQALLIKVFEALQEQCPKGIWIIAGGDGEKPLGKHLYTEVFPMQDLKREQETLGFFFRFRAPRLEFLNITNPDIAPGIQPLEGQSLK